MGIDTGLGTDFIQYASRWRCLERETGIEPASLAWKAKVLPLNYSRLEEPTSISELFSPGGGGWIRTSVGVSQQIYSLPPLATRAPLRGEPQTIAQGLWQAPIDRGSAMVGKEAVRGAEMATTDERDRRPPRR
jgi:hypothetical protein